MRAPLPPFPWSRVTSSVPVGASLLLIIPIDRKLRDLKMQVISSIRLHMFVADELGNMPTIIRFYCAAGREECLEPARPG